MSEFDELMKGGSKSEGGENPKVNKVKDEIKKIASSSNLGSKFESYLSAVKKGELEYILPLVSFVLSLLCIFTGLRYLFLSFLYCVNISFFAYMVRDSYSIRKKNIIPLIVVAVSILFTSIQFLITLNGLAQLANLADMFSY